MNFRRNALGWSKAALLVSAAALGAVGCATEDPPGGTEDGFISDNPDRNSSRGDNNGDGDEAGEGDSSGNGGGAAGEDPQAAPDEPTEDPERIISEADIIQTQGDLLFALSRYSGLAIISLQNPDQPVLLGRKALAGEPFEMYLDGSTIYAMFNGWGQYHELEDGGFEWVTSSHVAILDISTPSAIETLASFDLPGTIADSRKVGDVLYTVSFENGWCWDCDPDPNTTVTSFNVANPQEVELVDQLRLPDGGVEYGWTRSISVTTDRIYVGGVEWSSSDYDSSTIEAVDISDASGQLQLGASVRVSGQILSRWQMDEYEGVLRVISQPWNTSVYPRIETFQILSSDEITPIASAEIVTPIPESLRAVRFDGDRAFAITAEQVDPLFTIDLANPAAPAVVGELEIPGWVFHIEPRGDKLLALGFDNANADGSLNVSLFDVSDMTSPTLDKRVHFGGDWGNFAEDQDRIHKAFKILPDLGLILVPFSAWNWDEGGCGGYESGIQLVDWSDSDLTLRGVAPVRGNARRAFLHEDRLFALSDEQLRGYDISDRDEPTKTAELALSAHVSQVVVSGDHAVRLSADWWTSEPRLEIVSAAEPNAIGAIGSVDLGDMLASVEDDDSCYYWSYWNVRLFVDGTNVALVWPSWYDNRSRLAIVDISDPANPRLGNHIDVPMDNYGYYGWYFGEVVAAGDPVVQVGSTLAFQQPIATAVDEWNAELQGVGIRFIDISNPDSPRLLPTVAMTAMGFSGLVADGDRVLQTRWEPANDEGDKVRFFLDRIDLRDPNHPAELEPINVPGSLVSYDSDNNRLLTVDYERRTLPATNYYDCYNLSYNAQFTVTDEGDVDEYGDEIGTCVALTKKLRLTEVNESEATAELLDTKRLPDGWLGRLIVGEDRIFFSTNEYHYEGDEYWYENNVHVIGGMAAGALTVHTKSLEETWWAEPIAADGTTLLAVTWPGAVVKLDASNPEAIEAEKIADMPWWVQDITVHDGKALASLGPYGVEVFDLR